MWQNFSFFLEIIKRLESLAILFFMSIKPSSGGFMKKDPLLLRLVPLSPLVFDDSSCLLAFNNFLELEREGMNFYITKISDKMRGKNIPYPGYNNTNMDFLYCMPVEKIYLDFFLENTLIPMKIRSTRMANLTRHLSKSTCHFQSSQPSKVSMVGMNHSRVLEDEGGKIEWMRSINALIVYSVIHCGSHKNDDALSLWQDFYDSSSHDSIGAAADVWPADLLSIFVRNITTARIGRMRKSKWSLPS